jgi:Holliday junction resolvase
MPNPAYRAGDRYEKRVIDDLEANGYRAWQSRNSRGLADVFALKFGQILLVQVKSGLTGLSHQEWNGLYELAIRVGAVPLIADRDPEHPKRIRYRRILALHNDRKHDWPAVPWSADDDELAAAMTRHPSGKRRTP